MKKYTKDDYNEYPYLKWIRDYKAKANTLYKEMVKSAKKFKESKSSEDKKDLIHWIEYAKKDYRKEKMENFISMMQQLSDIAFEKGDIGGKMDPIKHREALMHVANTCLEKAKECEILLKR